MSPCTSASVQIKPMFMHIDELGNEEQSYPMNRDIHERHQSHSITKIPVLTKALEGPPCMNSLWYFMKENEVSITTGGF